MIISLQEKTLFQKRIPWRHLFLLCSSFRAHPTTLLLKIPHIFGGTLPPVPPRSPPLDVDNVWHIF